MQLIKKESRLHVLVVYLTFVLVNYKLLIEISGKKPALIAWTNEISTWTKWLPLEKRLCRDGFIESTIFELTNNEANVCSFGRCYNYLTFFRHF